MNRAPWLEITRIKTATIPEWVALDLLHDIDSAVRHRDAGVLRNLAHEAAASGLDQESARCREIADVIESKPTTSARAELLKIKSALVPPPPTQAEFVRRFDAEQLAASRDRGSAFDVNSFEQDEARRAEIANEQLRARLRRHEEQRAAQAARDRQPKGPRR